MFARTEPLTAWVTLHVDGQDIRARPGDSAAASLIAAGITATRRTAVSGGAHGAFCMMGACFDCLAIVDGVGGVQLCLTTVQDGMRIETQHGARTLADPA